MILIGCIYRPPPNPLQPEKSRVIDGEIIKSLFHAKKANDKNIFKGMIVAGDFNFPNVEWSDEGTATVTGSPNNPGRKFINFLNDEFITQNVWEPTFKKANGEAKNTLDYILSDIPERISNILIGEPLSNTRQAHLSITWDTIINSNLKKNFSSKNYCFSKGNYEELNKNLCLIDWQSKMANQDTNASYETFLKEYNTLCELSIPQRNKKYNKPKAPWITDKVKKLSSLKKQLWHINQASGWKSHNLVKEYTLIRNQVKKEAKLATINFEQTLANNKKNPKLLYAYVSSRQKTKDPIGAIRNNNNTIITDKREIANTLNEQFSSVFVNEPSNISLPNFASRTNNKIANFDIKEPEVAKLLSELDKFKSCGTDCVHSYVLKSCADSWAIPLSIIFRKSLDSGEVPEAWKEANITPLYKKKGCRLDASNYRPISLTSVICKIMEKLVKVQVVKFLTEKSLISKHQHGFMSKRSCTTNLLEAMDYSTKAISDKNSLDILFIDFEKAFDKVPHKRLLLKLSKYGIEGKILNWFEAFLNHRKQRVVLGEAISDWKEVKSGVPQGSVIGPILFIIYINDLPDIISNPSKMYADDTKIQAKIDKKHEFQDTQSMQIDINNIIEWTNTWLMRLNINKCKIMHVGKKNNYNYTMNSYESNEPVILQKTELERDLGILISNDLKFTAQSNKAAATANRTLGLLKKTFRFRGVEMWKKLYTTYVRPHLEFAVPVWNPYLKGDIEALERIQHRATKIAHDLRGLDYSSRCVKLDLSTLKDRRTRGDLIQKYKIEHKIDNIEWPFNPTLLPARGGHRGYLERELIQNCGQRHNFFNNRIANKWNELPEEAVSAKSLNSFKNIIDKTSP